MQTDHGDGVNISADQQHLSTSTLPFRRRSSKMKAAARAEPLQKLQRLPGLQRAPRCSLHACGSHALQPASRRQPLEPHGGLYGRGLRRSGYRMLAGGS